MARGMPSAAIVAVLRKLAASLVRISNRDFSLVRSDAGTRWMDCSDVGCALILLTSYRVLLQIRVKFPMPVVSTIA
jgi:hypothetical protein